MKNKTITLVALLTFLSFSSVIHAQTKNMEIGIRYAGLNYYDFVYKQAKNENTYRRFTLGVTNLLISGSSNSKPDIGFISAFSIGTEHRKNINSHLKFIHGFEPLFALGYFRQNATNLPFAAVGLGYVLGFQYDFSD
ncbi:MAG: hypothetical protein NT150_01295, partial [Bacteroidetes bacterium]|nr:hypothetical protein [Bacteroidota bacterium]